MGQQSLKSLSSGQGVGQISSGEVCCRSLYNSDVLSQRRSVKDLLSFFNTKDFCVL